LCLAVGILVSLLLPALPLQGQQLEWARQTGSTRFDTGTSVAVDASGNVCTTGSFVDTVDFDPGGGVFPLSAARNSAFVTKLDGDGKLVWARSLRGGTSFGRSVAVDGGGNVYITGSFEETVDFDPGGGVFELSSIAESAAFVTKLDSAGKFVWAKVLVSGLGVGGVGVAVDGGGNVYVTGRFEGVRDFDPGPAILLLSSNGTDSSYITKLDGNGNLVWAQALGGSTQGREYSTGVAVDGSGNVYMTGYFDGTSDFGLRTFEQR